MVDGGRVERAAATRTSASQAPPATTYSHEKMFGPVRRRRRMCHLPVAALITLGPPVRQSDVTASVRCYPIFLAFEPIDYSSA